MESIITRITTIIPETIAFLHNARVGFWLNFGPVAAGIAIQLIILTTIILLIRRAKNTKFNLLIELLREKMYEFFEEILGRTERVRIKSYVTGLFFIVLLMNLSLWLFDMVRIVRKDVEYLEHFVHIPTADFNFTIALAVIGVAIAVGVQLWHSGLLKFIHEYIPLTGKNILTIEKGNMPTILYYPVRAIIKLFDIVISMFIGLLDIVGIVAKVISLSARLYGNMLAGGILLTILVVGVNALTQNIANIDFPVIAPLILYAQGLLVAVIQAFVFPLLVAIFIKIAQAET